MLIILQKLEHIINTNGIGILYEVRLLHNRLRIGRIGSLNNCEVEALHLDQAVQIVVVEHLVQSHYSGLHRNKICAYSYLRHCLRAVVENQHTAILYTAVQCTIELQAVASYADNISQTFLYKPAVACLQLNATLSILEQYEAATVTHGVESNHSLIESKNDILTILNILHLTDVSHTSSRLHLC